MDLYETFKATLLNYFYEANQIKPGFKLSLKEHNRYREFVNEYNRLTKLSSDQIQAEFDAERAMAFRVNSTQRAKMNVLRQKCKSFKLTTKTLPFTAEVSTFISLFLKQLDQIIDSDDPPAVPLGVRVEDWHEKRLERCRRGAEYSLQAHLRELERFNGLSLQLKSLLEVLNDCEETGQEAPVPIPEE